MRREQLDTDDDAIVTIRRPDSDFVTTAAGRALSRRSGGAEPRIFTTFDWRAAPANLAPFPERIAAGMSLAKCRVLRI